MSTLKGKIALGQGCQRKVRRRGKTPKRGHARTPQSDLLCRGKWITSPSSAFVWLMFVPYAASGRDVSRGYAIMQCCTALIICTLLAWQAKESSAPPDAAGPPVPLARPADVPEPSGLPSESHSPVGEQLAEDSRAIPSVLHRVAGWPEVWGTFGFNGYFGGNRMAPNGAPFTPLFSIGSDLNLGLLPHKELYIFAITDFWCERASPENTNPHQGSWDFSKREFDLVGGLAWNYLWSLELRAFVYSFCNLKIG